MNPVPLPHCSTCDDGTACGCAVRARIWMRNNPSGNYGAMACGCMGFTGCPDCKREMPNPFADTPSLPRPQ